MFFSFMLLLSCSKQEETTEPEQVFQAAVYAVPEGTPSEIPNNFIGTRNTPEDTIFVWYNNLNVLSNLGATKQTQFEGVVSVTAVPVKKYFVFEVGGVNYFYDGFALSIKVTSGRIYKKVVHQILANKGIELTEITQDSTKVFTSNGCGSLMYFKTRKVFTDESAIEYKLCRAANHSSGRGARFLFINR